jgi:hypothetical protein
MKEIFKNLKLRKIICNVTFSFGARGGAVG